MNKNILTGMAITALALASASSSVMANNAASITDGFGCNMFDQYGAVTVFTDVSHAVINHGAKGVLKCYAATPNDSGKAIRLSGFACYANGILTYKSMQVIDDLGNATLTCQNK